MRPLTGIVRSITKKGLLVRLESGLEVEMNRKHGIEVGDHIWVGYDFTAGKAKYIEKPGTFVHPVGSEHVEEEKLFIGNNDDFDEFQCSVSSPDCSVMGASAGGVATCGLSWPSGAHLFGVQ